MRIGVLAKCRNCDDCALCTLYSFNTAKLLVRVPVKSYACQLIPCHLVPKSTHTHDQLVPVPKSSRTQGLGLGPWVRHDMGTSWFWVWVGIGCEMTWVWNGKVQVDMGMSWLETVVANSSRKMPLFSECCVGLLSVTSMDVLIRFFCGTVDWTVWLLCNQNKTWLFTC